MKNIEDIKDIPIDLYILATETNMSDYEQFEKFYLLAISYFNIKTELDLTNFSIKYQELLEEPTLNVFNKIIINNETFSLINFDEMSTGEFIDLDIYSKEIKFAKEFMSILYRKNHLEPYTGSNSSSMDGIGIKEYKAAIKAYNDWKIEYVKMFPYLFPEVEEQENDEDELRFVSDEEQFMLEFGWYPMIYMAANEQFLNIDSVVEKKATEFLYFINFLKRKQILDKNRIKKPTTNY